MSVSLNNRLIGNNEVLTGNCSLFTVPLAQNAEGVDAVFADMKDSDGTVIAYGKIKALWIINPLASGVDFWLRGPGDLSPTANNDEGVKIPPGSDTFLPMTEGTLNSWGGNQQDLGVNTDPLVFVVFR